MKNLKWFGTITSVLGSFIVALGYGFVGYCAFVLGAVSWLIVGFKDNNKPLITLNAFFLAANLIGLYRALL